VRKTECSACPIHQSPNSADLTRHSAGFDRKHFAQNRICSLIDFYVRSINNSLENFETWITFPDIGLYEILFSYNQIDSAGTLLKVKY